MTTELHLEESKGIMNTISKWFQFPTQPVGEDGKPLSHMLPDLTTVNDTMIGVYYSRFTSLAQYAHIRVAQASVEVAILKRQYKIIRSEVRMKVGGKTREDKEALVDLNAEVLAQGNLLELAESVHTMCQAFLENSLVGREAISREMTRRQWQRESRL